MLGERVLQYGANRNANDIADLQESLRSLFANRTTMSSRIAAVRQQIGATQGPFVPHAATLDAVRAQLDPFARQALAPIRSALANLRACVASLDGYLAQIVNGTSGTTFAALDTTRFAWLGNRTFQEWWAAIKAKIDAIESEFTFPASIGEFTGQNLKVVVQALADMQQPWFDNLTTMLQQKTMLTVGWYSPTPMQIGAILSGFLNANTAFGKKFRLKLYCRLGAGGVKNIMTLIQKEMKPKARHLRILRKHIKSVNSFYGSGVRSILTGEASAVGSTFFASISGQVPPRLQKLISAYGMMGNWLTGMKADLNALYTGVLACLDTYAWPDLRRDTGGLITDTFLGLNHLGYQQDSAGHLTYTGSEEPYKAEAIMPGMLGGQIVPVQIGGKVVPAEDLLDGNVLTDNQVLQQLGITGGRQVYPADDIRSYVVGDVDYDLFQVVDVIRMGQHRTALKFIYHIGDLSRDGQGHRNDQVTLKAADVGLVLSMEENTLDTASGNYAEGASNGYVLGPGQQHTFVLQDLGEKRTILISTDFNHAPEDMKAQLRQMGWTI